MAAKSNTPVILLSVVGAVVVIGAVWFFSSGGDGKSVGTSGPVVKTRLVCPVCDAWLETGGTANGAAFLEKHAICCADEGLTIAFVKEDDPKFNQLDPAKQEN